MSFIPTDIPPVQRLVIAAAVSGLITFVLTVVYAALAGGTPSAYSQWACGATLFAVWMTAERIHLITTR